MISRRNSLQIFGLLISILLTGVGVYGILLQFRTGTIVGDELIRQILLLGEGAFAIIGSLFLMLFFRNTPSPGVLFFILAVQATAFGALRPLSAALFSLNYSYQIPAAITRAYYFGRFLSILALFISGLFAAGLALQRRTIMFGSAFFMALTLAAVLPVDISEYTPQLLFSIGARSSMFLGYGVIAVLSTANYLIAALHQGNRNYYLVACGVFFMIIGKEFVYRSIAPEAAAIGLLCMIVGAYLFGSRTHTIYLWL
jgi:hypothetical protein